MIKIEYARFKFANDNNQNKTTLILILLKCNQIAELIASLSDFGMRVVPHMVGISADFKI